jgi:hypothetical protein
MLDSFYDDDSDDGSAAFATVRSNASARENVAAATATSVFSVGAAQIELAWSKDHFIQLRLQSTKISGIVS